MPTECFNSANKADRPPSAALDHRLFDLNERLKRVGSIEELAEFEGAALSAAIADLGVVAPKLGTVSYPTPTADDLRRSEDGPSYPTTRFWVRVDVTGDVDLLRYWPDATGSDLPAVDAEVIAWDEALGDDPADADVTIKWDAHQTWRLRHFGRGTNERALYTHIDLTKNEEREVRAGTYPLRTKLDARYDSMVPIVDAISEQVLHLLDVDLPARVPRVVANRREELVTRQAVRAQLKFSADARFPAPVVVTGDPRNSDPALTGSDPYVSDSDGQPDTQPEATEPNAGPQPALGDPGDESVGLVDITLDTRVRLAPVAFEDLQKTIRVWVNGVERFPKAFTDLDEDRVSDLLCATLNATMPGAAREAYSRGGKTDIFIRAGVPNEDLGPAKVFICFPEHGVYTAQRVLVVVLGVPLVGPERTFQERADHLQVLRRQVRGVRHMQIGHAAMMSGPATAYPL